MKKLTEAEVKKTKANLVKEAKKKGVKDQGAYIFGTLRKLGWRPKRET